MQNTLIAFLRSNTYGHHAIHVYDRDILAKDVTKFIRWPVPGNRTIVGVNG